MKITETGFKGLLIIETELYGDKRGWFTETYTKNKFSAAGIDADFVQDNQSYSAQKGTLRGIHFQVNPQAQTKLIRCTKGAITDTVIDLRKGSDTYKKWFSVELSAENKKQLLIPKGFGHAFLTLTEDVEVQYKVDAYYSPAHDRSIRFDDPELKIDWGIANPILSQKDANASLLAASDANFSIKVLVTGAGGQLGHDVAERLKFLGIQCIAADLADFDLTDREQTEAYIVKAKPDVVVHCAAFTAVDKAEEEKEQCYAVNVEGTKAVAAACRRIDAKLIYLSTDYVFSGQGSQPQAEEQAVSPLNYYGYSKAKGEEAVRELVEKHFIVRTSWVFGKHGGNFVKTMLNLANKEELNVVCDQIGSPTYTKDLAVFLCELLQTKKYGAYHAAGSGQCSWYEFAREIFKCAGLKVKVNPVPTSQYPTKATRPLNSRLAKTKLRENGFACLPPWEDALKRYLKELAED